MHEGEAFDSKLELKRWLELKLLERAGEISGLRRQVPYMLMCGSTPVKIRSEGYPNGRPCRYRADFVYEKGGVTKVEDVKGGIDDGASRLRRAVVEAGYGIRIEVVR